MRVKEFAHEEVCENFRERVISSRECKSVRESKGLNNSTKASRKQ